MNTITAIWNDAGLLREDTATRYASNLQAGSFSLNRYSHFLDRCRRIARLTGLTIEEVVADITEDALAME